ncbi:MAG: hypothetical protein Kow001_19170 [Acidobacteriota bacterium]
MVFVIACAASLGLAFLFQGTVERPRRAGGLAVLAAVVLAVLLTHGAAPLFTLRVFWMAALMLFAMGAVDDLLVLSPVTKLAVQVAAAGLFVGFTPRGTWGGELELLLGAAAFPVWIFWLVGITNAVNLLDNIDGLTPATGLTAALCLLWLGMGADWVLWPLAGALAGLLCLNGHRARIYLGDSGSHLVGFSLAALPLFGIPLERIWIPVMVLAVPIVDTAYVTITRWRRGVSPFQGGKDHLSHRLLRRGWPGWLVWSAAAGLTLVMAGAAAGVEALLRS